MAALRDRGITGRLGAAVLRLRFDDIPFHVVEKAKLLIADTLAVAWAGRNAAGVQAATGLLRSEGGRQEARLWSSGALLPAGAATFVNALQAAALDYDSLNGSVHADIVALPAAFALAERQAASGRDFLAAYVIGAELIIRLGRAAQGPSRGWSPTAIFGGFGAAAACARLLGLDANAIGSALGLVLGQAAGTQQANVEQVLLKRLQPALAARAGVFAAQMAQAGLTGPGEALEGRFGLAALYQPLDTGRLLDGFGSEFLFAETGLKKYPVCACSHAPMDALLHLVTTHDLGPGDIATVEAEISPFMARLVGNPEAPDADPQVLAQFSLRHALACIILRHRLGLAEIAAEAVKDSAIRDIAGRILVRVDAGLEGSYAPSRVRVLTRDGRNLVHTVAELPGSKAAPLSEAELSRKLADCAAAGPAVLDLDRLRASVDALSSPGAPFAVDLAEAAA